MQVGVSLASLFYLSWTSLATRVYSTLFPHEVQRLQVQQGALMVQHGSPRVLHGSPRAEQGSPTTVVQGSLMIQGLPRVYQSSPVFTYGIYIKMHPLYILVYLRCTKAHLGFCKVHFRYNKVHLRYLGHCTCQRCTPGKTLVLVMNVATAFYRSQNPPVNPR